MSRPKKTNDLNAADNVPTATGSASGMERLISSLRTIPSSERPVIEIVSILTFGCVGAGRDPQLCFAFGLAVIVIHVLWSIWKQRHFHGP
jgi:hypothetical protein